MDQDDIPAGGGYVYIMASKSGVLYLGSTDYLAKRVWEHKEKSVVGSFTSRYNITKLLYFEVFEDLFEARNREYQLKNWSRKKKLKLIERENKLHLDLAINWFE